MKSRQNRLGFTLVEMLIVLGIIVLVAGIFVPVILNLTDRNQVPKAASMLENALSLAKARAIAEKRPNGVRLVLAADNLRTLAGSTVGFAWYDELQYIEDPSDYVEAWVWGFADPGPLPASPPFPAVPPPPARGSDQPFFTGGFPIPGVLPTGFDGISVAPGPFTFQALTLNNQISSLTINRNFLLFGPISMAPPNTWTGAAGGHTSHRLSFNYRSGLLNTDQPTGTFVDVPAVLPGDVIEITGVGELYRIEAVSVDQGPFLNVNISDIAANPIRVPILVLDRPLSTDVQVSLNARPNYRIIRKPRAIPSMQPVKLPQDVVIDLTNSRTPFLGLGPQSNTDQNSNSIYMSGVSSGIQVSDISGLTVPVGPIQAKAPRYIDIMFSPSGEIMSTNQAFGNSVTGPVSGFSVGASGFIALWVHQRGDPNLWAARQITAAQGNADNQALVSINARTGFIGSYPINRSTTDPLAFARTGKGRLSSDTGP